MRFGVAFIPAMPHRRVVELARLAEELGFDDFFLPDQTFHRDPFVLLSHCAEATTRIRLGLAVTNPYTRHPVQIARAAGLLAEISHGRFLLGLGAGNRPRVLAGLGIEQTGVVERLREAVDVIRRLLAGESVSHASPSLELHDVALDFDPGFDVPIVIATRGARVLALAGELTDGAMVEGMFTPPALDWALATLAEGAQRGGRTLADVETFAWQALVLGDDHDLAAQPRPRRWAALLIRTTRRPVLDAIGVSPEAIESVAGELAHGDGAEPAGTGIPADDVAKLLLVGTPGQLSERVREVRDRGLGALTCTLFGEPAAIEATMRRFAKEVVAPLG
jgi:5,10-methylenetetrahydromethanopterin reductase